MRRVKTSPSPLVLIAGAWLGLTCPAGACDTSAGQPAPAVTAGAPLAQEVLAGEGSKAA